MGISETLNSNKAATVSVVTVVLIACLLFSFWHKGPRPTPGYFTIDGGKTFFSSPGRIAPFKYHGKTAYAAIVFSCDGGAKKFVGYLGRFSPANARIIAKQRKAPPGTFQIPPPMEVRRIGGKHWYISGAQPMNPMLAPSPANDGAIANIQKYDAIVNVKCPGGGSMLPTVYYPR